MAAVYARPTQLSLFILSGDSLLVLDTLFSTRRAIGQSVCVYGGGGELEFKH